MFISLLRHTSRAYYVHFAIVLLLLVVNCKKSKRKTFHYHGRATTAYTKKICAELDSTLRARHKTCFLRPDSGPCRADIVQWYFDVKQHRCYRFFWGGCQGNGNKFETEKECRDYCYLNTTTAILQIPHFCSLSFDYGTCFGYYHRWTWDKFFKTCKRRLYSGCGGNQNNFETRAECFSTCLKPPNNTLQQRYQRFTTCVPFNIDDLM
ncbi:tissue factor pathway inhibitor-like [Bombyx mandarina]|uniref:BPTI/Kunitz inhibitor domain-containing protein n=2 Tax=Bombyx TaxID=7090 RepID=A0A8R2GBA2_BOMMO|nr:tissue factor pathway inhibitor-like [Bombyx mori]XP_028035506.1 tissue factor pathway inhibitor-like [Bombyx mandarina]